MDRSSEPLAVDALALHLSHGTQQAVSACRPWIGRGDAEGADRTAVAAMRDAFDVVPGRGRQERGAPLSLDDLVRTDDRCFVATSVTWGELLPGPERAPGGWRKRSFVASPLHRRLVVEAVHPDSTTGGNADA